MKTDKSYVKIDSRNRITIPKTLAQELSQQLYKIYKKGETLILEPIKEVPKEELWLFDPKNKELVQELKSALKQKAHIRIDLDELERK
jgi:hypothetical protein